MVELDPKDVKNYKVSVVNDNLVEKVGNIIIDAISFDGKVLFTLTKYQATIPPNTK